MRWTSGRAVPIALAILVALAGCTSGAARKTTPERPAGVRPNIVFVLTDDLSTDLLPYLPAVQAMQRGGVTFENYYVANSLCCPSRAAILTGRYPHDTHVLANEGPDGGYESFARQKLDRRTFAVSLQHAGYRTGFLGKYLNGYDPDDGEPVGWDDWFGVGNGYAGFDYTADDNGQQRRFGHLPQDYMTDVLSDRANRFVSRSRSDHRPFLLEVSTFAPHRPWTPAPRDARAFPDLRYPRDASFDQPVSGAPHWLAVRPPLTARDTADIDGIFRQRVRAVQAVDDLLTELRNTLRRTGQLRHTYVVFSSDNGYHMGEHRLIPGKQTAFDTDIRVPLVVTGPGVASGRRTSAIASSIDLAPTFERIARAAPSGYRDGVGLLRVLRTASAPPGWQRGVLVEHRGHTTDHDGDPDRQSAESGDPPSYEAVRTATGLYVEYVTGEREFYDTATDPTELHNVVGRLPASELSRYATMLAALRACRGATRCQAAAG